MIDRAMDGEMEIVCIHYAHICTHKLISHIVNIDKWCRHIERCVLFTTQTSVGRSVELRLLESRSKALWNCCNIALWWDVFRPANKKLQNQNNWNELIVFVLVVVVSSCEISLSFCSLCECACCSEWMDAVWWAFERLVNRFGYVYACTKQPFPFAQSQLLTNRRHLLLQHIIKHIHNSINNALFFFLPSGKKTLRRKKTKQKKNSERFYFTRFTHFLFHFFYCTTAAALLFLYAYPHNVVSLRFQPSPWHKRSNISLRAISNKCKTHERPQTTATE